jgi:hypothetical protein
MLGHLQLDLCSVLLSRSFSQDRGQLSIGFLLHNVKLFSAPTISRLLLVGIRVFRGPRLLKTYLRLIKSAMHVVRRVILPISAPIHAHALLSSLRLHLPVEPTLFLLLPSKTMHVGESTMLR